VVTGGDVERDYLIEGVRVHSVPRRRVLNDQYRDFIARRSDRSEKPAVAVTASSSRVAPQSPLWGLRQLLSVSLNYPDYSRGWLLKAARAGRRIVRRADVDLVISSGPPHLAHLVGILSTAGTKAKWIMDMRDPWSDMTLSEVPLLFRLWTRILEKIAFARADHIICNTRQFADALRQRKVGKAIEWVPNGVDLENLPPPVPPPSGSLSLAYVGSLCFNRDLGPVIRAMEMFLDSSGTAGPRDAKLVIAGSANPEHEVTLDRQVRESSLAPQNIERLGRISRDAARKVLQEAHLSLVLAQGQPFQVPAKLYESVALGLPTLVLTEPGSAAASEAERVGAIWRDPADVQGIRVLLERLSERRKLSVAPAAEAPDYRSLTERLADVLRAT
jgi:glycosyltransferase involved in cell wall biosynthesis